MGAVQFHWMSRHALTNLWNLWFIKISSPLVVFGYSFVSFSVPFLSRMYFRSSLAAEIFYSFFGFCLYIYHRTNLLLKGIMQIITNILLDLLRLVNGAWFLVSLKLNEMLESFLVISLGDKKGNCSENRLGCWMLDYFGM